MNIVELPLVSTCNHIFPHGVTFIENCDDKDKINIKKTYVDVTPRPIMASSNLINMLSNTNAGHYVEFRPLQAQYQTFANDLQKVPASRSDIFQTKFISPIEKRMLSRFVKSCIDNQQDDDDKNKPLQDYMMNEMNMSDKLQSFILTSIVFGSTDVREGCDRVQRYTSSMQRFGTKTPFLFTNYGTGELTQALCRLCAVHGGTYVLRRGAKAVVQDERGTTKGLITSDGDYLKADHIFISRDLIPENQNHNQKVIWRFAGIIDGSIVQNEDEQHRFMISVPINENLIVRIRQNDQPVHSGNNQRGHCVIYAECSNGDGDQNVLMDCVKRFVNVNENEKLEDRPNLLWGMIYARDFNGRDRGKEFGVAVLSPDEVEHDVDSVVSEAERGYRIVHPDGEFFPDVRDKAARNKDEFE